MKIGLADWLFSQINPQGRFKLIGFLTLIMLMELLIFAYGWLSLGLDFGELHQLKLFLIYPLIFVYLRFARFFARDYWLRYGLLAFGAEFILYSYLWSDIPLELRLAMDSEQVWTVSMGILWSMHRRFMFFWFWASPVVFSAAAACWAEWQTDVRARQPKNAADILDDVEEMDF